jgi:hypothetical protein
MCDATFCRSTSVLIRERELDKREEIVSMGGKWWESQEMEKRECMVTEKYTKRELEENKTEKNGKRH